MQIVSESLRGIGRRRKNSPAELDYYRHGGIFEYVLRQLLAAN
jgi:aconitase A